MKTERVTLLTSPAFKHFLVEEAKREGVSVGELVRSRCERRAATEEEAALEALAIELRAAIDQARRSLRSGVDEAQAVLDELRGTKRKPASPARGRRTKVAA